MAYLRALSTLGCPELTLEQVLALAVRHGISAVELRSLAGTVELPAYLARTYTAPEKMAARFPASETKITALATSLKVIGGTAADREVLLQFVPWAEALEVPWLRVFDGGKNVDAAELAEAAATLQWWRQLRAQNDWKCDLMVETHDTLVTGQKIRRLLDVVPGTAIRWDSHHTWKKGGEDPVATWHAIKDHVVSVDVKDSISRPSARHAWTYVLPGAGEFPMAPLKAVLGSEYSGPVCFEWEKLWHPYLPSLEEALAVAKKNRWW